MKDYKLTPAQVGRLLNRSPDAVRNMILRGELPAVLVGRHFRINEQDLEGYLARQQIVPSLEPRMTTGRRLPRTAADIDPSYDGAGIDPSQQYGVGIDS
jgi:excisionase family DNA binding protein